MHDISQRIKELSPDLVFLQEVFLPYHKEIFKKELGFPYSYLPRTGILGIGGGLCCFSQYPISEQTYIYFSISGYWTNITWTDKIVQKGFAVLRIKNEDGQEFHILNTHITSNYSDDYSLKNRNTSILKTQLTELAAYTNAIPKEIPYFIVGDLNIPPDSELFSQLLQRTGAIDLTPSLQPSIQGNQYHFSSSFSKYHQQSKLDYVLFKDGANQLLNSKWRYVLENRECVLSDHLGLLVDVNLAPDRDPSTRPLFQLP